MKRAKKKIESYSKDVVYYQVQKYQEEGWKVSLPPLDRKEDKVKNKIWTAEMIKL